MNSLNDFCPTHFSFFKLNSKLTFQKTREKGVYEFHLVKKNVQGHQLNGKTNTREGGAGMGRNHKKSDLWAGWAWEISYPIMKLPIPHRIEMLLCCKNSAPLSLLPFKGGSCPQSSPHSQARPPEKHPGAPEGQVQTWRKNTTSHFLFRPQGKCLLALRGSPTWWEGWCWWKRKTVWERGKQNSVWVSRRRGQLSQINSLSPLFENMTNSWL